MKRKILDTVIYTVIVGVMSLTSFSAIAQEAKKDEVKKKSIPVKIKYMENGKIISNAAVYFLYYDSDKSELVEKTANTGNGKVVSFDVPFDKDDASFPFVVLYTKKDVNEAKELVKTTTINAYRIPPDSNCEFLELSQTKGGGTRNEGCSIQMWSMGKE